jgi:ABC-2 type transport system permease protein
VILGKTIPYLLISLVASVIVLLLGNVMFDVQVAGSIMLLFVAILILVIGALGQGLLISTVTDSQQVAFIVSVFSSLLPSFLLSGFVFPVSSMPVALQIISNIAVAKYFLVICRGIILKGAGFGALWEQYVYLSLFAVIILLLSIRRMKKDLV